LVERREHRAVFGHQVGGQLRQARATEKHSRAQLYAVMRVQALAKGLQRDRVEPELRQVLFGIDLVPWKLEELAREFLQLPGHALLNTQAFHLGPAALAR